MRICGVLVLIVLGVAERQKAWAQGATVPPEPPEYLVIENTDSSPISVYIKPHSVRLRTGAIVGNKQWFQPVSVEAGQTQQIRLPGYEPFDISVVRGDGTAYSIGSVNLCQIMVECARNNWTHWTIPMVGWRLKAGKYVRDEVLDQVFESTADRANVTIHFSPTVKTELSRVRCTFLVVDGSGAAVEAATLILSTSSGESLGVADLVTDADGKASVELADDLTSFHVRVVKVGTIEQKEFKCTVKTDVQKLRVQNRRQQQSVSRP